MRPSLLRNTIRAKGINEGVVVIDEIQRLPDLLNEVHMLIEEEYNKVQESEMEKEAKKAEEKKCEPSWRKSREVQFPFPRMA